jgi:ABC-2 type transport system ATP-binding protein
MRTDSQELNHRLHSASASVPSGFSVDRSAISARDLCMSFGRTQALTKLNLDIPQGAIYALVGPNGAGKSTLIKLLVNIIRPTSGTASILGLPTRGITGAAFAHIGYVSENQELPDWMTVSQLLHYLRPFYPQWDVTLEIQLLRQLNLPADRKLKHLSRGQRMKAALLSVLPYRPSLIVLDEPFSGLDPLVRDELIESLLDRAAQDSAPPTILISSHDLAEIETLASHVGYLDSGHLLFSEEISGLISRFREVTITLKAPQLPPKIEFPSSWLVVEARASMVRFFHSHFDTEPSENQIASIFPNATIEIEPMNLRSIFLALAKSSRPVLAAEKRRRA